MWLIELKTEKTSHRPDQIPGYFALAHHHYPDAKIDLLYVTSLMDAPFVAPDPWGSYAHTTWPDLAPLIRWNWPAASHPSCQELVDGLLDAIGNLDLKPREWRERFVGPLPGPPEEVTPTIQAPALAAVGPVDKAMELAALTADDGQQRAVEFRPANLEDLLQLRVAVRSRLAGSPADSPLRHVEPWIWRPEAAGQPMTDSGQEFGRELRLSRHKKPLY